MSKISRVMKDNAEAFIISWRGTTSEHAEAIFKTDKKRIEFLFEEYNKVINNLKTKKSW